MAEAIGVASSVLAFAVASIKITVAIVELINGIKDAPQTIADLQDSLLILRTVLDKLAKNEEKLAVRAKSETKPRKSQEGSDKTDENDIMVTAVKQCNKILKRIADVLEPMQEKLKKGKFQASWVMFYTGAMDKSMKEHFETLERAKSILILALTFDTRFAVVNSNGSIQSAVSATGSSSTASRDVAPPAYSQIHPGIKRQDSDFDPTIKRQNSEMARTAARSKAIVSKLRFPGKKHVHRDDENAPGTIDFSKPISSTIDNVSKSISADGKSSGSEDYNTAMLHMLWHADLDKVQDLWGLNPQSVVELKVFVSSLKASPATMKEIGDAAPDTLQWIDHNVEYIQWRQSEDSELLLLEGKAGSGKSVFTKTLWNKVSNPSIGGIPPEETSVLSYFCNNRMRPSEACPSILRAYICQYLRENKSDFTRTVEACDSLKHDCEASKVGNFDFSFDILLDIFETILKITAKKRIYCIIDAMDECTRDGDMEKFTECLKKTGLVQSHSGTIVKFFISTRPDWITEIGYCLIADSPLKIVLKPELTGHDIAQVVEQELCKIQSRLAMDPEEKAKLKSKLIAKAEGMMLWVILAFREIPRKIKKKLGLTLKFIKDMVEKLPLEIFGMYDHIMANIKKRWDSENEEEEMEEKDEESNLSLLRRLILWVARSGRPLTVTELQYALAIDMDDTCFGDTKDRVISNLEDVIGRIPFLEIVYEAELYEKQTQEKDPEPGFKMPEHAMTPTTTVRFIHQTAKEYILQISNSSNSLTYESGGANSTWPQLDDVCIGKLCVKFLSFKDFESGPIRGFPDGIRFRDGFKAYIEEYAFLEYAASFWFWHLTQVPDLDDFTKNLVSVFSCDLKENLRLWCQLANFILLGEHTDLEEDFFGLHVAASLGIDSMVKFFIDRGDYIDKRDERGRTPYMMADWGNFQSTKTILEDAGANTDLEAPNLFSCDLSEFHKVVISGNTKEIQQAIDAGVDIDEPDSFGRTALFYAGSAGDADAVKLLLKANAGVKINDKHARLPIDVTLDSECRKLILDKMMETSVRCNPQMLSQISCDHTSSKQVNCDICGRMIWTFYHHCCYCSLENDTFEICQECWDSGKKCSVATHDPRPRVRAGFLTSWIDYTPHLQKLHIENPIKELEKSRHNEMPTASRGSVAEASKSEPIHTGDKVEKVNVKREAVNEKVPSAKVTPVQEQKEKSAGCGCVIL